MKFLKSLLVLTVLIFASSNAFAAGNVKIEAYAHPTMFGTDLQQFIEGNKNIYVTGEKLVKPDHSISVQGKSDVLVESWAKDVLSLLEKKATGVFNPKMPILRSEMAVVLAEGLSIKTSKPRYTYKDIASNYWAKSWIDKVLTEGVMIGYPDQKFRPDQPITKAEVFATIAQLINVSYCKTGPIPAFKGYKMQNIPTWAINPTKEVLASSLLDEVPDTQKAASDKYLSKEQVAYLVGALRQSYAYDGKTFADKKYQPTYVKVKMQERVDARHANIGDIFWAKTTEEAKVDCKTFPVGSIVKGEVVEISRPGIKNPGYIKVKFLTINNDKTTANFTNSITDASVKNAKTTNVVARLVAAPLSIASRTAGVAGRTASGIATSAANNTERYGDDLSNTLANTFSLKPVSGVRSAGKSFVTVGRFVYDTVRLTTSGAFGVVYEIGDEIRYLILPSSVNGSALNPNDELVVIY